MDELKQALKVAHASNFSFYLKTHGFHWNVEGPNFPQLHELFANIYEDVYGVVDRYAEEIRALQSYAPASLGRFQNLSQIQDQVEIVDARQMLQILHDDNLLMLDIIKQTYDIAEQAGAHGLSNFLAERQDMHKKWGWQLRATLK
jgi:starvation-inducible DNA-binding protein